jgi:hypothetical protein
MLDKIGVNVDVDLSRALSLVADQCELVNPQAAAEARALSRATRGAVLHVTLNGPELVCKACDALRAANQPELVAKMETLIKLVKQGKRRQVFGNFFMGAPAREVLQAAGAAGANIVGLEDPRSGNVIPIAKVKG